MASKRLGIQGYVYIGQDGGFDREALWGEKPGKTLVFNFEQYIYCMGEKH
jgi:hypothetical protein